MDLGLCLYGGIFVLIGNNNLKFRKMIESFENYERESEMQPLLNALVLMFRAILVIALILIGSLVVCVIGQTRPEVLQEIVDQGIKHPKIVMAQFRLETGNGTSKKCRVYKNLFGMKFPAQRKTTALGIADDEGYAYFSDWKSAITDYKIWQDTYYKNEEEDYYVFLKRIGYATSTEYIKKLKEFNIRLPK